MSTPALQITGLHFDYGSKTALHGVDLEVDRGEIVALLGPNGSGKTTLLQCANRLLKARRGEIHLLSRPLAGLSRARIARHIAYVPQVADGVYPMTVLESVLLGLEGIRWRYPTAEVERAVALLEHLDMPHLAHALLTEISGGERQKAAIARALMRETPLLLLDEPSNHLDLRHQRDLIRILQRRSRETGQGILVVLHDINIATQLADRIVLMREGRILAQGPPSEIITRDTIQEVYGVDAGIVSDGATPYLTGFY
ncbi:iron complex transport system ATP-binding protein [Ectothiorhodospira mobilis]|uniref:Iron complex transport system ATP-binding protein n=1 Tax=Ectothiorhodospira mobilis TaxID=195064 RepID=A0A1I4Q7A9_ECTMO|nr:ABC transporter ATP-binding protein [Ectothiorhodospira mobilis]SFM35971.1 iron complex transport system ATP-binding protein [Ectothiorhodospira mobilis]